MTISSLFSRDKRLNKLDLPIGTIVAYSGDVSYIPDGWHLCDGTGGTPDLRNQFLMGAGVNSKGDFVSAGLPNITGSVYNVEGDFLSASGAFNVAGPIVSDHAFGGEDEYHQAFDFNASRSNPIYGNSTTVQPPALTMRYIIKY